METVVIIVAAVALICTWLLVETSRLRRLGLRIFEGRCAADEDPKFCAHFAAKGVATEVFSGVRAIVGQELGTEPLLLRPQDDFTENLRPLLGEEQMADLAIIQQVEKRFQIVLADAQLESCKTVDDLVSLVHQSQEVSRAG